MVNEGKFGFPEMLYLAIGITVAILVSPFIIGYWVVRRLTPVVDWA